MNGETSFYRRILKNSFFVGGSSIVNILAGFFRTKLVAILLGPSGVGLSGLFNAFITIGNSVFNVGIGLVGTRKIAEAYSKNDMHAVDTYRVVLVASSVILSLIASAVLFLLRGPLSVYVFATSTDQFTILILSLGVCFSIIQTIQASILQGFFRIKDIAGQTIISAILYSLVGSIILWRYKQDGLVVYAIVGPLISAAVSLFFMRRLPKMAIRSNYTAVFLDNWKAIYRQGSVFMLAGIVQALAHFLTRIIINNQIDLVAVGYYQAAFVISVTYLNFILGAMSADYYPNLSSIINEKEKAAKLVNEQTVISLLLAGPVLLLMISIAPIIISILYRADFYPAVSILRWQIFSDFFKILSWPLGYIILANGKSKTFFFTETLGLSILVLFIYFLLPAFGLEISGIGYVVSYLVYLPLVYALAVRSIDFKWNNNVLFLIKVYGVVITAVFIATFFLNIPFLVAVFIFLFFGLFSLSAISKMFSIKYHFLNRIAGNVGLFYKRIGLELE